ncbi:hypothetical protein NC653_001057 [Populus alba x Populus x berolinensis]|uniref:Uncharacterized protein n=1 Tax=Populus alba x Populus x berolinensis TaxID=444605 RepID=A0AAD6WHD4_9ROSI|nr:hypothetical protein NC653_001057 [Populus alba x Populus x berolinensis]
MCRGGLVCCHCLMNHKLQIGTACKVVKRLFDGQLKRRLPDEFSGNCSAEAKQKKVAKLGNGSREQRPISVS